MQTILNEIRENNTFFISVKNHVEQTEAGLHSQLPSYRLLISDDEPADAPPRTYNAPTCVEVAAIILGINPTEENHSVRYVTINSRVNGGNGIRRIPETHSSYDPLSYVCTHIHGDVGWNLNMKQSPTSNTKLTPMDYYSYRAQVRDDMLDELLYDTLLMGSKLALQYWCDQWIKIEEQRLKFFRFHQQNIKADLYQGLADAVAANDHRNAGTYTVLTCYTSRKPKTTTSVFSRCYGIS